MFARAWMTFGLSVCAFTGFAQAQTLTPLAHQEQVIGTIGLLLTDGRAMIHARSFTTVSDSYWYILTPDATGSYVNGTWKVAAPSPPGYSPFGESEAVLADGRVVVIGGEYNYGKFDLTNKCAIYDPQLDKWTMLAPPDGWDFIGDSMITVLSNGKLIVGNKLNKQIAQLDQATLTWTRLSHRGKSDFNSEEGWTLMPDGTILTEDIKNSPNTELYSPTTGTWRSLGSTPVRLTSPGSHQPIYYGGKTPYYPPGEIGPALLMPDGSVFITGAIESFTHSVAAHTAIYSGGVWRAGPDFPYFESPADSNASLLPNGHALVEGLSGTFYEFDGTSLITEPLKSFYPMSMLLLPTGEVLIGSFFAYASTGTYDPSWAPTITQAPSRVTRGSTYQIFGTQFNGLSQANGFGDELQTATNYPLVRITNKTTGHVMYARTHDHSTMGVATGAAIVSTFFDIPAKMEKGPSSLVVVANGIPSEPVRVTVR